MSEFRVTCMLYEELDGLPHDDIGAVTACVLDCRRHRKNSGTREPGWCVAKSPTRLHVRGASSLRFVGRNACSLYFFTDDGDGSSLLKFDDVFGTIELPDLVRASTVRVIACQDSRNMTAISLQGSSLRVFDKPFYGDGAGVWVLRKSLDLIEATKKVSQGTRSTFAAVIWRLSQPA
jgi:hypothetical protein